MINNITKFKKQCKEYNSFLNNIKQLTEDYCSLMKKKNPYKTFGAINKQLSIEESLITISYEIEAGRCGYEPEYLTLKIPTNFYNRLNHYELIMLSKIKEFEELEIKIKDLKKIQQEKKLGLSNLQNDIKAINQLKNKYKLTIDFNDNEKFILESNLRNLDRDIALLENKKNKILNKHELIGE